MAIPARFDTLIFHTEDFPADEQVAATHGIALAALLDRLAYSISAAVGLIDYCDLGLGAPAEWRAIAARDAAISAYHFRRALEGIYALDAPAFRAKLGEALLADAAKLTRERLPDHIEVRDAVAHVADFMRDERQFHKHAVEGKQYIFGKLSGRTLTVTKNGKHYSLVIDVSLRETTQRVAKMLMDALMDAGILREPAGAESDPRQA